MTQMPPPQGGAHEAPPPPKQKKKMGCLKPLLIALLAMILFFALVSMCAETEETTTSTPTRTTPTVVQEPDEDEVEEPAETEEPVETEEPTDTEEPAEEPEETEEPVQEPLVVTASQMLNELDENALRAKVTYEDQRVTVTGFVGNIDASGRYFALDPEPDAFIFTGIQISTDESFRDTVAMFDPDQQVTVTGTVTMVGEILGYTIRAESINE